MSETPQNPDAQNPDHTAEPELPSLRDTLVAGKDGDAEPGEIIRAFLTSTVYFLSAEEVTPETGSVNPLTLQDNDGNPLIAMFSATDVIPEEYAEHAPHAVDAPASPWCSRSPDLGSSSTPVRSTASRSQRRVSSGSAKTS